MDNETKGKAGVFAGEAKKKAIGIWTVCKDRIVALWKSGRKGKAICIGGMAVVLLVLGQCGAGSDGSSSGTSADGSDGNARGGVSGGDWEYTGKAFYTVFEGPQQDEGMIYECAGWKDAFIKIIQSTEKGNLVRFENDSPFYEKWDRTIWVETPRKNYEDGESLEHGFYIRRGQYRYISALGAERTVARYVEVTDKRILGKIQKYIKKLEADEEKKRIEEEKAREKARQKEKAEAEAKAKAELEAEGKSFEVDAPVKSLCGFAIGATPNDVIPLFKADNWSRNGDRTSIEGQLATPFRHFDKAELAFKPSSRSGGKHLYSVKMTADSRSLPQNWEEEDRYEEIKTIVAMLEKKFGIKFRWVNSSLRKEYRWEAEGKSDCVWQEIVVYNWYGNLHLDFESGFISAEEAKTLQEKKKQEKNAAKLSADVGADQL